MTKRVQNVKKGQKVSKNFIFFENFDFRTWSLVYTQGHTQLRIKNKSNMRKISELVDLMQKIKWLKKTVL